MAAIVQRRRRDGVAYQVGWRQDETWQSDTFGTKRQALRFQCDVEDAGNRWPVGWVPGYGYTAAVPTPPTEAAFADVAERYLLTRTSVSSYQMARYRAMTTRLAEYFPCVDDLDDESIAAWVRLSQERGVAAKTIANYHGLLHGICAHAVRKGLLPANPCALTRLPKVSAYDAEGEPIACFLVVQTRHRWTWTDVRRWLTAPTGRWSMPAADGIELFKMANVSVTRYRYRGNTIPNPWRPIEQT